MSNYNWDKRTSVGVAKENRDNEQITAAGTAVACDFVI